MNDLGLKYGFLTTYEDTVFLRQVIHNRLGVLEYSPVIHHSNTFSEVDGTVTLRQCFFMTMVQALTYSSPASFTTARVDLKWQTWPSLLSAHRWQGHVPLHCSGLATPCVYLDAEDLYLLLPPPTLITA